MKLKLLYLIVTSLLLGGCVSYDSISNSQIQENLEFKGKPSKPPVKIIETSPVFNEVIGAFGVTLEETSNLPTLKSGIKFIPGSHPSYLSDFRYFTRTQVWQHHSGAGGLDAGTTPTDATVNGHFDDSIGVYSFALKPEEHQPSGTCNFSRIDNAQLVQSAAKAVEVYAVNYNVLRIMSGMGGLAYSN